MKRLSSRPLWLIAAGACLLLAVPATDYYYSATWGEGCARCHEIRPNLDSWKVSAHRAMNCTECHSGSVRTNVRRVAAHLLKEPPERIQLQTADVWPVMEKCVGCHRQEYARWNAGRHAADYQRIFANEDHNRKRQLVDDCLRCHGMHFEGSIYDLVEPADRKGPWTIKAAGLANRPAIPCLSCHLIHRDGMPLKKASARIAVKEEIFRPSLGFFDRRARMNIRADILVVPVVYDGDRAIKTSPERRQALCYQCHAPLASGDVGSGDDRTPMGVHEGLGCLSCHDKHDLGTRQSCAGCHPRLSNCGIDVEKMDTTFADPKSRHNIHWVKCNDCHLAGVPKKKPAGGAAR